MGEFGTVRALAQAEKVNEAYISRALRLMLLPPDIGEAILDGRKVKRMTLPLLMDTCSLWGGRQGVSKDSICRSSSASPQCSLLQDCCMCATKLL